MQQYSLYNLVFESDVDLGTPLAAHAHPDVCVRIVDTLPAVSPVLFKTNASFGNQSEICLHSWEGVEVLIRSGSEMFIRMVKPFSRLKELIFSHYIPALFIQRGMLVLHASANKRAGGVEIFLGESGAGKSTLSASLELLGFPSMGEDCSICHVHPDGISVLPTLSAIRLLPGHHDFMSSAPVPGNNADDKVVFPCRRSSTTEEPLVRAFALEWGVEERLERLPMKEAMVLLLKHLLSPWPTQMSLGAAHLTFSAEIAKNIPMYRYTRPRKGRLPGDAGRDFLSLFELSSESRV